MIDLVEDPPAPVAKKRRKRRKKPVASLTRWEAQIGKKKFYSDQQPGLQPVLRAGHWERVCGLLTATDRPCGAVLRSRSGSRSGR